MWDPGQYRRFGDERARPFFELLSRVEAIDPQVIADLGCGPGHLTATLGSRWPGARIVGVDSSPEMIATARKEAVERPSLAFVEADIRDWYPGRPLDVLVSNAALQWVPGHLDVVARWPGMLAPGGWLAFQVPGNLDGPGHVIMRELASSGRWQRRLSGVRLRTQPQDPAVYLDLLARAGCVVDAWETTYLHVLTGEDPVLRWYRGSGLRPVLAALRPAEAAEFLAAYAAALREAYPPAEYGTVLPFRRVFAVARKP